MIMRKLRFIARKKDGTIVDIWEYPCCVRKDGTSLQITETVLFCLHMAGEGGRVEIEDMEE